jgi:hypothetical protein
MGNNFIGNGYRHKPKVSDRYNFHPFHVGLAMACFKDYMEVAFKENTAMAETKFLILLLNVIGYPVFGFVILYVSPDFKGWSLWAIAAAFGIYKLIHAHLYSVKMNQENKIRELELKEKEYNLFRKRD